MFPDKYMQRMELRRFRFFAAFLERIRWRIGCTETVVMGKRPTHRVFGEKSSRRGIFFTRKERTVFGKNMSIANMHTGMFYLNHKTSAGENEASQGRLSSGILLGKAHYEFAKDIVSIKIALGAIGYFDKHSTFLNSLKKRHTATFAHFRVAFRWASSMFQNWIRRFSAVRRLRDLTNIKNDESVRFLSMRWSLETSENLGFTGSVVHSRKFLPFFENFVTLLLFGSAGIQSTPGIFFPQQVARQR